MNRKRKKISQKKIKDKQNNVKLRSNIQAIKSEVYFDNLKKCTLQLYQDMNPQQSELCYTLAFGKNLIIFPENRSVTLQGMELKLTRKEYDLLFWLAINPGKVYSYCQIYDHVLDDYSLGNVDEVLKYHIKSLGKKMTESDEEYIKNVWGVGYRFANESEIKS